MEGMLIPIFILIAFVFIILGLTEPKKSTNLEGNLGASEPYYSQVKKGSVLGNIFPFSKILIRKLKIEQQIQDRLFAAHNKLAAHEFFNIKLLLMIAVPIMVVMATGKQDLIPIIVSIALSYVIPDVYLSQVISKRQYQIARVLPETVDLLGLCVEAGLDFVSSVNWLIQKEIKNPLIEEFDFVLQEIKWGKPRSQALKDMSKRLSIPEVSSFVQTLVQAERMGTPVSEAFMILSEDTRIQRFHRGERQAMQAPIKILIPLIFCILPVIGIVIGGPIFLQFSQGKMF